MLQSSPKNRPSEHAEKWFGYYAGYSTDFVSDALSAVSNKSSSRICDPWNGSGTTTSVAWDRGLSVYGYDLNPSMVVLAKARLMRSDVKPAHVSLAREICAAALRTPSDFGRDDPLAAWLAPRSASAMRSLEQAVRRFMLPRQHETALTVPIMSEVSNLAALFYVGLFRTLRHYLAPFRSSNPTWIKVPSESSRRIRPASRDLAARFEYEIERIFETIPKAPVGAGTGNAVLDVGDATSLPLDDASVDAVVSSPPYCTRIDYGVATRPELSILGMMSQEFDELRNRLMGTCLTKGCDLEPSPWWGRACSSFLEKVRCHPSSRSSTYYYYSHLKYFEALSRACGELARVIRPGGSCVLVVQDSHYKEIHNDLQTVVDEMLSAVGFTLKVRSDFQLPRTKAAVNTRSRKHRPSVGAVESGLLFTKAG